MALKLQSFRFVVFDYNFIYPKGTQKEDQEKTDPQYVKISGVAFSGDKWSERKVCYIMDSFGEFKLNKTKLLNLLSGKSVISGCGICKLDSNYNYRLELDSYSLGSTFWDLKFSTQEEK